MKEALNEPIEVPRVLTRIELDPTKWIANGGRMVYDGDLKFLIPYTAQIDAYEVCSDECVLWRETFDKPYHMHNGESLTLTNLSLGFN